MWLSCDVQFDGLFCANIYYYTFYFLFSLQNTNDVTAECRNPPNVPEVNGASSVQPLSVPDNDGELPAVEITMTVSPSAPSSAVKNCLPAIQQLTSVTAQMEELLNTLATSQDNGHASDSQDDARQNSPSAGLADGGGCSDGAAMETLFSRVRTHLVELRNNADLLSWSLTAKKSSSGSDSGHDDSSSLPPPEASTGDVASANADTDVSQQQSTDAVESSSEAAGQSSATNSREADGFVDHVRSKARQVYCAIVRPFRAAVASNVPEFTAEGNFMLQWWCFLLSSL